MEQNYCWGIPHIVRLTSEKMFFKEQMEYISHFLKKEHFSDNAGI